jgi:hypothetical protein
VVLAAVAFNAFTMLHELLLALSGHEGIIFGTMRQQDADIKVSI